MVVNLTILPTSAKWLKVAGGFQGIRIIELALDD